MNQSSSVQRLEAEQSGSNDFKIIILSPSENLKDNESYKSYEKRLASALKHKPVLNIALTGVYGSGENRHRKQQKPRNREVSLFYRV